ncbi:MAG: hypothetical protein QOJ66_754, partial [Ilumatobacteraceae bacterium]
EISSQDVERLLSGNSDVDETHELADVSAVLGALRQSAEPDELSGLDSALAAFGAAVVTAQALPSTLRTFPMTKKRLTRKSLAAIVGITLVSAGAAAAGGVVSTPFSAQRPSVAKSMHFASDDQTDETDANETTPATDEVDSHDATKVAKTDDATDATDNSANDATDGTDGQGPDVNGPAKFGLCTAYAARTKHDEVTTTTAAATPPAEPATVDSLPVPFQNLTDAAVAAGQTVAEFCADAVPGGSGKSGDNPSETAPGKSGDNPSITAPGQSDDKSAAKAHGKSGAGHGHTTTTLAGS